MEKIVFIVEMGNRSSLRWMSASSDLNPITKAVFYHSVSLINA